MRIIPSLCFCVFLMIGNRAYSQTCPRLPACAQAEQKATPVVNKYKAIIDQNNGIQNVENASYCINMAGAEMLRTCATELRNTGHGDCANMFEQQMNSFLQTARNSAQGAQNVSTGTWKPSCGL